jgi:hypothetical protein
MHTYWFLPLSVAAAVEDKKSLSILKYLAVKVFIPGTPDKNKLPSLEKKKIPKSAISDFNAWLSLYLGVK